MTRLIATGWLWIAFAPAVGTQVPAPASRTKIENIAAFLERCPQADPAYAQIRQDFIIRRDGRIVGDVPCTEPYSRMPIEQLTNPLITLQALRVARYMDPGVPGYLPWTRLTLYQWMASSVGGVNLKTAPDQLECCELIDRRKYIVESEQSLVQREFKREWPGIANTLGFLVHEARHANGGAPHTTGCEAFPNPSAALGCDQRYDVLNLGAYGVQYWLAQSWMTGRLNVGIACSPDKARAYIVDLLRALNLSFRTRFVESVPPIVAMPEPPFGGPCQ